MEAFRDFQVAAPLKRERGSAPYSGAGYFPRLPSRGPIEAAPEVIAVEYLGHFPRLPSRGPIEA